MVPTGPGIADDLPPGPGRACSPTRLGGDERRRRRRQLRYARAPSTSRATKLPAVAHYMLGQHELLGLSPDFAAAADRLRRAVAAAAASGDLTTRATAASHLAQVAAFSGDVPEAHRLIAEAIDLAERLGHPTILAAASKWPEWPFPASAKDTRPGPCSNGRSPTPTPVARPSPPLLAVPTPSLSKIPVRPPGSSDPPSPSPESNSPATSSRRHSSWPPRIAAGRGSERTAARLLGACHELAA